MKKRKKALSVSFEDSINITSMKESGNHWIFACYQMILVFLGVCGSIMAFVSGLELSVHKGVLGIVMLLSVLYYFFIFRYRKYSICTIPLTLFLFIFTVHRQWELFLNGFYYLENEIVDAVYHYFKVNLGHFITRGEKTVCLTFLFIIIIQVITFLFTIAIQGGILKLLCFLVLGIAVGVPLFLGKIPSFLGFLFCVVTILLLLSLDRTVPFWVGSKKREQEEMETFYWQKIWMKTGLYTVGIFALLSILVLGIGSDKRYQGLYEKQKKYAVSIEHTIREFSMKDFWEGLKIKVEDVFFADRELLFNIDKSSNSGGLSGGKLGSGNVRFTNETALKLTIPKDSSSLYLKGYVGVNYTGESWEGMTGTQLSLYEKTMEELGRRQMPAQQQLNTILFFFLNHSIKLDPSVSAVELKQREMIIDYVNANRNFLYLPYITKSDTLEMAKPTEDSYYTPLRRKSSYHVNYYDIKPEFLLDLWQNGEYISKEATADAFLDYYKFEQSYKNYVYEIYAKEPKGLQRLQELAYDMKRLEDDSQRGYNENEYILKQVKQIQNYLQWQTRYSLNPGEKPDNKDFAEYFLFDNRKGYCAHYATSAVLLLRCMNIPARYVEGYIVTKQDIRDGIAGGQGSVEYNTISNQRDLRGTLEELEDMVTVEIKDLNAHAWIEVYFTGFGWIPFEVTSGYSTLSDIESLNPEVEEAIQSDLEPTKLPTNTPTPTITNTPTPTLEANAKPQLSTAPKDPGNSSDSASDYKQTKIVELIKKIVTSFIIIFAVIFAIVLRRNFVKRHRKEKMSQRDHRRAVLAIYEEMDRLFRVMSVQQNEKEGYIQFANRLLEYEWIPNDFSEQLETVLCARFSEEEITYDQLNALFLYYKNLRKSIYRKKGTTLPKTWYLDYILVL